MLEPNCDMPWEIYLDWLQDQGNEDLRDIEIASLTNGISYVPFVCTSRSHSSTGDGYGQDGYPDIVFIIDDVVYYTGHNCVFGRLNSSISWGSPHGDSWHSGDGQIDQQGFGNSQFYSL